MKGTKRFAVSESNASTTNDSVSWNKRIIVGSPFDVHRAEISQQQPMATPPLNLQRAESSQQHVRALNTQFASWVQTQLKNHPDELWEDGVRDYLAHASNIMEKFTDVVNWLKANAAKGEGLAAAESQTAEKKNMSETKNNEIKLFQSQTGLTPAGTTTSFGTSWSSGIFSNNQNSTAVVSNGQSSSVLSNSQSSGVVSNSQGSGLFSSGQSFGIFSSSQSSGLSFNSQNSGLFSSSQSSSGLSFSNSQNSGLFSNTQSSGLFSNSQSSGLFSNNQAPVLFGNQSSVHTNCDASDDVGGENEEPPSSPSFKKTDEKGVIVVHEVKCKLYVKVLPVMVMGAFIPGLRRKYPLQEYVSAMLLVIGLILFTLADAQTSPNFHIFGVIMISGALIMDAFLGNLQEAIFTLNPDTTQMEMLFCSTVVGLPLLVPPMILTGELFKAWNSCYEHPYVYGVLVFEAMATYVGQVSVLSLVALFGAATTAMITTARKAVTLLLSYLIFTKPMTNQHGLGLLLISMGIIAKMVPEHKIPSWSTVQYAITKNHSKSTSKTEKAIIGDEDSFEDEEERALV